MFGSGRSRCRYQLPNLHSYATHYTSLTCRELYYSNKKYKLFCISLNFFITRPTLNCTRIYLTALHFTALPKTLFIFTDQHYTILSCTKLHYSTPYTTTLLCTTEQCTTLLFTIIQYSTLHNNTLARTANHIAELFWTTLNYSALDKASQLYTAQMLHHSAQYNTSLPCSLPHHTPLNHSALFLTLWPPKASNHRFIPVWSVVQFIAGNCNIVQISALQCLKV